MPRKPRNEPYYGQHRNDLTGQRFGRLTVLRRDFRKQWGREKPCTMWLCECDCGETVPVCAGSLQSGNTKSCGCLAAEKAAQSAYANAERFNYEGKKLTLRELSGASGIKESTLRYRMKKKGMSVEEATSKNGNGPSFVQLTLFDLDEYTTDPADAPTLISIE